MNQKNWIAVSAVLGFIGVAIGAFGAHGLKSTLTPEMMEIFKTGVQYQLVHAVAMLAVAFSGNLKYLSCEKFFLAGIILFSFSLYAYSITSEKMFAMITPVGGIFFLTGWVVLFINAVKKDNVN